MHAVDKFVGAAGSDVNRRDAWAGSLTASCSQVRPYGVTFRE